MYNKKRSCTISRKEENFATFQSQNLNLLDIRTPCDFFQAENLFQQDPLLNCFWTSNSIHFGFGRRKEKLLLHFYLQFSLIYTAKAYGFDTTTEYTAILVRHNSAIDWEKMCQNNMLNNAF